MALYITRIHFMSFLFVWSGICCVTVQSILSEQGMESIDLEGSVNEWDSTVHHRSTDRSIPKPSVGTLTAVYRRSIKDRQMLGDVSEQYYDYLERALAFGGYSELPSLIRGTWVYTPLLNSWYRLPLSSSEQPVDRTGHTMVSLCKTTVVLFGGFQDRESYAFNDTWLFNGIREEWKKLEVKMEGEDVKARAFHTGVVLQQERSSCQCKESLFVFGGLEEQGNNTDAKQVNDLLELRCQKEEDGERTYAWYRHQCLSESECPKQRHSHHAVTINDSTMLVYGGVQGTSSIPTDLVGVPDSWLYDSKRQTWRRFFTYALHHHSLQIRSCVVFDKKRNETFHLLGSNVYKLNFEASTWIEVRPVLNNSTYSPEQSMTGLSAISTDSGIFVFSGVEHDQDLLETKVWYLTFLGDRSVWQLNSAPKKAPPVDREWTHLYSCQVGGSLFIRVLQSFHTDSRHFYMRNLLENEKGSTDKKLLCDKCSKVERYGGFVERLFLRLLTEVIEETLSLVSHTVVFTQWELDLNSNTWWQYSTINSHLCFFYSASTGVNGTNIVTYGTVRYINRCNKPGIFKQHFGSNCFVPLPSSNVCLYHTRQRRWIEADTVDAPPLRLYPSLVDVGNDSVVMIGGFTCDRNTTLITLIYQGFVTAVGRSNERLANISFAQVERNCSLSNDVWLLRLLISDSSVTGQWTLIDPIPGTVSPPGRIGHLLLTVDSMVFMAGGSDVGSSLRNESYSQNGYQMLCSHDLWYFDLIGRRWWRVQPSNHNDVMFNLVHPLNLCKMKAGVLGKKLLIVRHSLDEAEDYDYRSDSVVTLSLDSNEWIQQTDNVSFPVDSLHVVDNSVYVCGSLRMPNEKYRYVPLPIENQGQRVLTAMRPGCHAGWYSENWSLKHCSLCPIGKVAVAGSTSCSPCPSGLTTKAEGATNMTSCICDETYCGRHGTCFVVNSEGQLEAQCQCEFGYTGSRCQYPTYYIITTVAIVILLILFCLGTFLQRMIKYRRVKQAREMELEEMGRVWTIDGSELRLIERIDGETPGSYGNIYRARYRDMNVAVKKLKMVMRAGRQEREFEREILLMRSIRHANIVLFVGAGRFAPDECPFLVLEFMQRGALSAILHDESIYLNYMRQITFCLDAAKGMEFLHSLQPPRIHRDLKSSNLLVSEEWTVKVADFGAARLVKAQRARQTVARRRANAFEAEDLTTPLLQPHSDLSRNAGAVLWRAPEIFLEEAYGTSADVYR